MFSAESPPGSAALVVELSMSFREELKASIQSALGVAVEIAVVEVTKLMNQALRDVRDQMHETLRDNKRLEARLRDAESELHSVRGCLAESQRQTEAMMAADTGALLPPDGHEQAGAPEEGGLSPARIAEGLEDEEDEESMYEGRPPEEPEASGYEGGSFCEIGEDGSVRTQDLMEEVSSGHQAAKHEPQENASLHFDQVCDGTCDGEDLMEGSQLKEASTSAPGVVVKMEKSDQCGGPESGNLSGQEEFGSDCLSLAQSRLLEDWRPEALQLQNCQSNSYTSSASNDLADPSIFPGEIPELDFITSADSIQPDPLPSPARSRRDVSSSKRRSLVHPKPTGHHHKSPKRSLFPPGRSPYHCSQCGRDFNRMDHLKIHQRIHTGERPYVCTVCSALFRHSWALKRHSRIHTGEMPYQCGQCGKTFRNCGGMKLHQRSYCRGHVA